MKVVLKTVASGQKSWFFQHVEVYTKEASLMRNKVDIMSCRVDIKQGSGAFNGAFVWRCSPGGICRCGDREIL